VVVVIGCVVAAMLVLLALRPRAVWRVTQGWAYRDPDANEPSSLAFGLTSVLLVVLALGFVIGGFAVSSWRSGDDRCDRAEELYDARADEAEADRLADDYGLRIERSSSSSESGSVTVDSFKVYDGDELVGTGVDGGIGSQGFTCE